jgi:hypothetical protein
MTYDKNSEGSESYGRSHGPRGPSWGGSDPLGWAKQPGFHPLKAVATVAAFAVFPPLGVLTLGYFLWNSRRGWQQGGPAMAGGPGSWRGRCGGRGMRGPFTGNQAFDEHQMETINKLREERRAFQEHRAAERAKRDTEAYEAFRAAQAAKPAEGEGTTKI